MSTPELSIGGQVRPAASPLAGAATRTGRRPDLVWGLPAVAALVSAPAWSWRPGYRADGDATVPAAGRAVDVTATNRALVAAHHRIAVRYHPGLSELLFVRRGSAAER